MGRPLRTHDYAMLLESVYDGVLITDSNGRILEFNSRVLEFFRCRPEELSDKSLLDLISAADVSLLERAAKAANEGPHHADDHDH